MKNKCALITGAGEGLGRSFALACASRGYDLLLVSLKGSKLERLSAMIEDHYQVKVWFLEENLCENNSIDKIISFIHLNGLAVDLLINNAGIGHTDRFDELSDQFLDMQLTLNIHVLTLLTRKLIPLMGKHVKGQIINIGSMASFFEMPNKNSYAASKAYVKHFSLSLHSELRSKNIGVSVVCPNGINSNIHHYLVYKGSGFIARLCFVHPDDVAGYALQKSFDGNGMVIPGRINRIIHLVTLLFPDMLKRYLANQVGSPLQWSLKPIIQPSLIPIPHP